MRVIQLAVVGLLGSGVSIVIALGFQLIFSTSRMFHFAYAAVYAFGIYMVYFGASHGQPLWISLLMAAAAVLLITALMELFVYRRMRRQRASQLAILIASLGMLIGLQNLMALFFGNEDLSIPTPGWLRGNVSIGGVAGSRTQLAEIVLDVLIYTLLAVVLRRTAFGKDVRAVADDPMRAELLGVDVNRVIMGVLLIGTLITVPIAALAGMDTGVTPYASTDVLLVASIIVFVGGLGSMTGTFVVAVVIGILSGLILEVLPSQWSEAFSYGVLVAAVLIRPRGIFFRTGRARSV